MCSSDLAAYNTACLYAALATRNAALEKQVVTSLKRAINNPDSEMERAYDWISHDPDFRRLKDDRENFPEFNKFLDIQRSRDYPLSRRAGRPGRPGHPESPESPGQPLRPERPERPDRPERPVRPERTPAP